MTQFLGIDLGTTNSVAALFDGEQVRPVRPSGGGHLVPSVVHLGKNGRVSVGDKAKRLAERDPRNSRTGFKRLMGTDASFHFPAVDASRTPVALSAALLSSIRDDVQAQTGVAPQQAVITVPAIFDLPQSRATTDAALEAGFRHVELVQEPVASALAAGWTQSADGHWLVFDLGGGTFDVTLLDENDGFLRVVGHDGHNFLGGRDIDRAIYNWLCMERPELNLIDAESARGDDEHAVIRAVLRLCEDAKIELSSKDVADIAPVEPLHWQGQELDFSVELTRAQLELLVAPLVDKAIQVCLRLLASHELSVDDLQHVVMVGGPSAIPLVRTLVEKQLAPVAAADHDPMTLVAQGAALQAAALSLPTVAARGLSLVNDETDAPSASPTSTPREPVSTTAAPSGTAQLFLRHPSMCRDRSPYLVGKVLNPDGGHGLAQVVVKCEGFVSSAVDVEDDDTFLIELQLPHKHNTFTVRGQTLSGDDVDVMPGEFQITYGVSISDPPVARSVGVARASNDVTVFFQRGDPLPAERSFQFFTVDSVEAGNPDSTLRIPMVQGDFAHAHLCQPIGAIVITGDMLQRDLAAGSEVEVTLQMDRGGHLKGTAHLPSLSQTISQVCSFITPHADLAVMREQADQLSARLSDLQQDAFGSGDRQTIREVASLAAQLSQLRDDLSVIDDAQVERCQQLRTELLELVGDVFLYEQESKWPELDDDIESTLAWVLSWTSTYATADENQLLERTIRKLRRARERKNAREVASLLTRVTRLGNTAFHRSDNAVIELFHAYRLQASESLRVQEAQRLVQRGQQALDAGDMASLRQIVDQLGGLMPRHRETREKAFSSGID